MTKPAERFGIKCEIWEKILGVLKSNPNINDIILFGSRAKGNFKQGSDIDLCLKGKQLSYKDLITLRTELDALNLPWIIDLLHYESVKDPAVIEHINRVGIKLS